MKSCPVTRTGAILSHTHLINRSPNQLNHPLQLITTSRNYSLPLIIMLHISALYIYPIKSLPGISVGQARLLPTGLEYDRRWMLVDEGNMFLSQRTLPEMTQLRVAIRDGHLEVTHRSTKQTINIPIQNSYSGEFAEVTIWDDTCRAEFVNAETDKWFSNSLGIKCRLVYMPDDIRRIVDQRYAPGDNITSFSDGYPLLLIGQASLDDLNSRLDTPIPMNRFRPNIVFAGGKPFDEDVMNDIRIGNVSLHGVKPCARCPVPAIDQETGERGKEPLKTLAKYRAKNNKIYFGQNLVHGGCGILSVGDTITVESHHTDERFLIGDVTGGITEFDKTLV